MSSIKSEASKATLNPVVVFLTRLGNGARGYLFFVIGLLALQVALGNYGRTLDEQGAIAATAAHPAGKILLVIVLAGLVIYILWALACAVFDLLHVGHDLKGLLTRAGFFGSAIIYALMTPMLTAYIIGGGKQAGSQNFMMSKLAATIFLLPGGKWLVAIAGIALIITGLLAIYSGFRGNFGKEAHSYSLSPGQTKWIKGIGHFGTAAYGVSILTIGVLFFRAFTNADPYKATGLDGALLSLVRLPFGPWLLGLIALGLISYGIYFIMSAIWFRIQSPKRF